MGVGAEMGVGVDAGARVRLGSWCFDEGAGTEGLSLGLLRGALLPPSLLGCCTPLLSRRELIDAPVDAEVLLSDDSDDDWAPEAKYQHEASRSGDVRLALKVKWPHKSIRT